jgi:zinc protease
MRRDFGVGGRGAGVHTAERGEVDGIPIFWSDSGSELATASLMFRVGSADETIQTNGITHLVEHMALEVGPQRYGYNGTVEEVRTVLWARGTRNQLKGFLEQVTANLADPPMDSIGRHARVLRTEAAGQNWGWVHWMKEIRFGASPHGLSNYDEFALHWLGPDEVGEWARTRFTAENAVAWMSCAPPDGLRLGLPHGRRIPPVRPEPLALPLPMHVPWSEQKVAVTMMSDFNRPVQAGIGVLEHALNDELCHRRGLSYHVGANLEVLYPEILHFWFSADCLRETALEVRHRVLATMERLGTQGPTPDELQWNLHEVEDQTRPGADEAWLDAAAFRELIGLPVESPEAILQAYAAVTAEDVAEALSGTFRTAVMLSPEHIEPPTGWAGQPPPSSQEISGRTFAAASAIDRDVDQDERLSELTVGEDGISVMMADGTRTTCPFKECAGVGWDRGSRYFYHYDGSSIGVEEDDWERWPEVVAALDAVTPEDLFIALEGSAPGPRVPPRPPVAAQVQGA